MQSLGQAVYRYICSRTREGEGASKREIIEEMKNRGYLEPLAKRIDLALQEDSWHIGKIRGRFVKKKPYWAVI